MSVNFNSKKNLDYKNFNQFYESKKKSIKTISNTSLDMLLICH